MEEPLSEENHDSMFLEALPELPDPIPSAAYIRKLRNQIESETAQLETRLRIISQRNKLMEKELDLKFMNADLDKDIANMRSRAVASSILRIFVTIVAFFITYILAEKARYYLLLSHQLSMAANALILVGPDPDDTFELAKVTEFLSSNISFGSIRKHPVDSILRKTELV